jgi:hypothetical protein
MTATDKDTSGSKAGPSRSCGVDVAGQCTGGETGRQQHNDRGNVQAAGQDLGPGGECENQADPDQNLVCCHAGLR